ncbi:putative two-component response regulator [Streptomyces sp. NBRC 110611]|nr:putative two-component response regulator [Streptomyces sp. NBRC 110611]
MRVLVAAGEECLADLADTVIAGLRREAITTDIAHDGREAMAKLRLGGYDVLVLDQDLTASHGKRGPYGLQGLHGPYRRTRVLMLTASGPGLGLGADDCLAKPFAYEELLARVRALGRRPRTVLPPVIEWFGVTLDTTRRLAHRDGRPLALSRAEFGALEVLLRAQGGVVSGDDLIEEIWEEHTSHRTNAVRVTLGTLRAKLGDPPLIETVPGAGYRVTGDRLAGERLAGDRSTGDRSTGERSAGPPDCPYGGTGSGPRDSMAQ